VDGPGDHASTASGWLGKLYDTRPTGHLARAPPGLVLLLPRYLLRIFKWPATVVLGTVGIPTIA
jgi:hypothetical protein